VKGLRTIIFTGVSGGGKTTALRAVEDLGFYCVDNLPLPLLGDFVDTMIGEPQVDRAALVVDSRLRNYIEGYALASLALKSSGHLVEVVYLDARDDVLIRRFSQTRRPHPLGGEDLVAGLQEERKLLAPLRAQAAACLDTSELTVHQLKQLVQDRYQGDGHHLVLSLLSFGFRYGLPMHADLVFDVRFLPNPFFIDDMRHLSGMDSRVQQFVLQAEDAQSFVERIASMLEFLLPRYAAEGKVYFTSGIGCTGGRHRSVAIVEELGRRLAPRWAVRVRHRDIDR
jgi:RNase adapter protein RapZ